ncbi:hypothetical protein ASPZODRAFT_135434 [Penicilliopsis zonata CBS 506.65]|uniref:Dephospho-CoA kinase n=1 Tax=Penicilliopsis zonata CBS 506.65 TaxID=1073090 RepID=A0A1L9S9Z3_9EURO|nr:hypothetical protein ASPZODRAFT_135434 [Penicilliopsis zonata CBS 506.65]OJJ44003.1 hypothetical protein ASPZODRAFT_135434 [Penicilliopsis zonata CBS 506.65]
MLIIGLTGSIATGKSTASSLLASPPYSLPIIDADLIARRVVEPGTPGYNAIVNYFGPTTPDLLLPAEEEDTSKDGNGKSGRQKQQQPLNRPALGRRVFGDSEERRRDRMILNKIVHPAVRWEIYKALAREYLRGSWAVVLDVPLLFESGMDLICGSVVVVGVRDPAVQMQRLRARDPHLSAEDAENRVRSQGDVRGKVARAEYRGGAVSSARGLAVWNDGDKADLEAELAKAMTLIRASSPRWWSWLLLLAPPLGVVVATWNVACNFMNRKSWDKMKREEKAKL